MLAVIHQRRKLGPAPAELISNMPPGLMCHLGIALQESLADRGGDHGVLTFRHVGQGVAHPMNPAALPSGAEHASDREAQAVMSIRDHQLDTLETALDQALQKGRPASTGSGGSASEGPMPRPTISRRPSVLTATAIIAAAETMRPPSRTFR